MNQTSPEPRAAASSERVLVLVAGVRERALTIDLLARDGVEGAACTSVAELCQGLHEGAGAALVAEEFLTPRAVERLTEVLKRQPPWSDFPIVVFSGTHRRVSPSARSVALAGNITFLDRPVRVRTMLAAVHSALASRRRQYQARSAIDARDAFLALLGHELRNPLNAILMAARMLETRLPEVTEHREYAILHRQSQHLGRLVDDLLDVARVTHGKVVLERERLDLADVVRATFEPLEARARERSLTFELEAREGDGEAWVDGDRHRLEQVFSNLLTNAIKYTLEGGRVRMTLERQGASVVVAVRDTGIGLAADMIDRVFAPFAQVEVAERAKGGLGLGLAVVRSLVELHGGTVTATSEGLGKGSVFSVRLPVATSAAATAASPSEAPAPSPRRIVVVEDTADLRELFVEQLELAGHEVTSAEDGLLGLEMIVAVAPHVAFVDLGLPTLSGIEVAQRLRASGAKTYLVAVTGYGQPQDRRRALAAGFDEHLVKPASEEDFARAIAAADRR